jgi:hypothetical protein
MVAAASTLLGGHAVAPVITVTSLTAALAARAWQKPSLVLEAA